LLPEAILVLHLLLDPLEIVEVFFGTLVLSLRLFALLLVLVFEVGYLLFPLEIVALQDLKLLGLVFESVFKAVSDLERHLELLIGLSELFLALLKSPFVFVSVHLHAQHFLIRSVQLVLEIADLFVELLDAPIPIFLESSNRLQLLLGVFALPELLFQALMCLRKLFAEFFLLLLDLLERTLLHFQVVAQGFNQLRFRGLLQFQLLGFENSFSHFGVGHIDLLKLLSVLFLQIALVLLPLL
jgi:hypothetical protein